MTRGLARFVLRESRRTRKAGREACRVGVLTDGTLRALKLTVHRGVSACKNEIEKERTRKERVRNGEERQEKKTTGGETRKRKTCGTRETVDVIRGFVGTR
jgi:hypothetical protein